MHMVSKYSNEVFYLIYKKILIPSIEYEQMTQTDNLPKRKMTSQHM